MGDRLDRCGNPFHKERGGKDRDTEGEVDITKSRLRPRARADHLDVGCPCRGGGVVHLIEIEEMRLYKSQNKQLQKHSIGGLTRS